MNIPVPKYEDGEDAKFFLEKFEGVAKLCEWTNEQKCLQLCLGLPKSAQDWFLNQSEETKSNFDALKSSFENRFGTVFNRSKLYNEFVLLKQESRSVVDFVEEVVSCGRKLHKPEQEILDKVLHGLNLEIRKHVLMKEPRTIEEITNLAKLAETVSCDTIPSHTGYRPDRNQQMYPKGREARRENCVHCGRYNHLSMDCFFRNATCYVCKEIGHHSRIHHNR